MTRRDKRAEKELQKYKDTIYEASGVDFDVEASKPLTEKELE